MDNGKALAHIPGGNEEGPAAPTGTETPNETKALYRILNRERGASFPARGCGVRRNAVLSPAGQKLAGGGSIPPAAANIQNQ